MTDRTPRTVESPSRESGFGIIEVVIAMFLLGLIAIAFLPLLQTSLRLASKNVTSATATQLVNAQMDKARSLKPSCAAIQELASGTLGNLVEDPRGTVLEIHMESVICPPTYPGTVIFTTSVTVQGSNDVLSQATTRVFVESKLGTVAP
ncbi:type II secretion system protein [Mycetocola sp. 2940]|uniref:type IV pilus modification PilV family protein n=1 Tax=Mycetocola sp. 2940 TaxID=3156452 RepID=UPI0033949535